jgi:DNA polymerase-3 subunit delta'
MTVWDDLVGQQPLVHTLQRAVVAAGGRLRGGDGRGMTSAWLFIGPPGSGRSNAARAFAAALQCEQGGCGTCHACHTTLLGSHPDVTLVATEMLSIGVDAVRDLVRSAALMPSQGRWQVVVVEDADRLTEDAGDALLKSLEEPASRTIWVLCAPTAEDVLVTVRSRCRLQVLRTPPADAIAAMLVEREGVAPEVAAFAARASQGHIGRARALSHDEASRNRRREVLAVPTSLVDLGACMVAAANLHEVAQEQGEAVAATLGAGEIADHEAVYGRSAREGRARGYAGVLSALKKDQAKRKTRVVRDSIDGTLVDLLSVYRDVLVVQTGASSSLINGEARADVDALARRGTAEATLGRMEAVLRCRKALTANAAPLLALEAMMLDLRL